MPVGRVMIHSQLVDHRKPLDHLHDEAPVQDFNYENQKCLHTEVMSSVKNKNMTEILN